VQAGIYFTRKDSYHDGGDPVYHYRGFNQGSIDEQEVIKKWSERGYSLNIPTRRFITMGTALASEEMYNDLWCTWNESVRMLQIQPNQMLKRQADLESDGKPNPAAATSLLDTYASDVMMFTENVKRFSTHDIHGQSLENYLSRKHRLPWDAPVHKTEMELFIEEQEKVAWEITDSEI
jgi:hypothetical protein